MPLWLIIMTASLGAGMLLLHGFSKTKESSNSMMTAYKEMLEQSLKDEDEDGEEEASEDTDDESETDA